MNWTKVIIGGAIISAAHFALTIFFFLYFGLGMSRTGADFTLNIWAQPGTFLGGLVYEGNSAGYIIYFTNAVFYFFIGCIISILAMKKFNNSQERTE